MAQFLYIALGFGVGLSAAGAVGALALLRWTEKPDEGAPEANVVVDAESQVSEPNSDQVAEFEATLARQGLSMKTKNAIEATVNRMDVVDPRVTKGIIQDNWSAIAVETLDVDIDDIDETDYVGLRFTYDLDKVETSFRDAQQDLEASSR